MFSGSVGMHRVTSYLVCSHVSFVLRHRPVPAYPKLVDGLLVHNPV